MKSAILRLPTSLLLLACATLGLAPFFPAPHIWEKISMLTTGTPMQPIDFFDLVFHGTPWVLLALKLALSAQSRD